MSCSSTQKNRFQLRRANEGDWYSLNPTLLPGEPAVSMDTKQIKIGTGAAWRDTDYINLAGGVGTIGTPTTLATLIVLEGSSKNGTQINLSSQTTLSQNQAVAFDSTITDTSVQDPPTNIVANKVYFVFTTVTNSNTVQVKLTRAGASAY